ncbi:3635_t:CDS:2 [Ambispora gerdemannii]|uniref:3635_t:CDS:1 n=1 Tax=Ambispora gerdemannii TaxID=144530 RepID=A0A9N9FCE7_9GLOM|nr:3635_t:CDS:2 [Ambispora gerdemannii]
MNYFTNSSQTLPLRIFISHARQSQRQQQLLSQQPQLPPGNPDTVQMILRGTSDILNGNANPTNTNDNNTLAAFLCL